MRSGRGKIVNGLNSSALDLFERSRRTFERTYNHYGRAPSEISANALTLDFEIETNARVKMTPELLLERGGVDMDFATKSAEQSAAMKDYGPRKTAWPKLSDWFTAGVDGTGIFINQGKGQHFSNGNRITGTYRQDLSGQIELESVLMRPKDVLQSSFTKDLQSVIQRLYDAKTEFASLRSKNHLSLDYSYGNESWYQLPFEGSKGIKIFNAADPIKPCLSCHVQWTAGLPLHHVSFLLRMSNNQILKDILHRVDDLCAPRDRCTREYHSFISLAAWAVSAARQSTRCGHPKRYMEPWLVRTHFGDLATMLKEKGEDLQRMAHDVLQVAQLQPSDRILGNGTVDYLRLPEMAELTGMVYPRNPFSLESHKETEEDMPTDIAGLLHLSEKMLQNTNLINQRLHKRQCGLHSKSPIHADAFTVKDWLDGMKQGMDLMSDHDSPLSKSAFSGMVWKSMGSWRMRPRSNRVYLECRNTGICLANTQPYAGAVALIRDVGLTMTNVEKFMALPPAKKSNIMVNSDAKRTGAHGKLHHPKRKAFFKKQAEALHQAQVFSNGQLSSKKKLKGSKHRSV